jgi:hypothetical protein
VTTQSRSLRLADQLVAQPYAWPGGYPLYAIANDGEALCKDCCKDERQQIATTTGADGWGIAALAVNWEDSDLRCAHCSTPIEAAYTMA